MPFRKENASMTDKVVKKIADQSGKSEWRMGLRLPSAREILASILDRKNKNNLSVFIEAAKGRREALDHVLLTVPLVSGRRPCLYYGEEMCVDIKVTQVPYERLGSGSHPDHLHDQTFCLLMNSPAFPFVEEILYPAMETSYRILIGQDRHASMKLEIPKFTLIGATTRLAC